MASCHLAVYTALLSIKHFPTSRYLVAPFWDNVDTRGGNGRISYEIHQSGFFLEQINTYLNRKRPSVFQGTWMAVVYYDRVHPYRGIDNPEVRTENQREIPGADPGCYDNRGSAYNIILASGTYTSRTTGTIFRPSTRKGT